MNSNTPFQRNTKARHTPWRFYYQLRQHGERIQTALKNGPGYGAEIKHRYNISTQIYKKIVRFLAENPSSVVRAFKYNRWDAVEDIVFAASGPSFRRLPSFSYVIELLKVTCPHQFYYQKDVEPMVVESAMAENATTPPTPIVVKPAPPRIEAELPPEPETGTVQEIPAIQPPPTPDVQVEWAETNADLQAVEILEPRLGEPTPPDPEAATSPKPADASAPIPSEPAPAEPPTPPTSVTPAAPPSLPPEASQPHPSELSLEQVERWIKLGMAAEACLSEVGIRRLLGLAAPATK